MLASIIIPSLNSPAIAKVLNALDSQHNAHLIGEIIVVGRDEAGLIGSHNKVRFIDTGEPVSASRARNIGIEQAKQQLLVFLDSDCLPAPNWLDIHVNAHLSGRKVVGGGVYPKGDNYWSLTYNLALFHEFLTNLPDGTREYLPLLNLSAQRSVVDQVGGFDDNLARGQDLDWTIRMRRCGYTLHFNPDAAVSHVHERTTLAHLWRDCARSGYYSRGIRIANSDLVTAPFWLHSRLLILCLSPFIAIAVTSRIAWRNPRILLSTWRAFPGIALTKLAWCWGAGQSSCPPASNGFQ